MRLLRERHLEAKTGQGRSSNYRAIANRLLPPPIKYGPRNSVWPEYEIDTIIAARIAGKTDDEIRQLVSDLVDARPHALDAALAGNPYFRRQSGVLSTGMGDNGDTPSQGAQKAPQSSPEAILEPDSRAV